MLGVGLVGTMIYSRFIYTSKWGITGYHSHRGLVRSSDEARQERRRATRIRETESGERGSVDAGEGKSAAGRARAGTPMDTSTPELTDGTRSESRSSDGWETVEGRGQLDTDKPASPRVLSPLVVVSLARVPGRMQMLSQASTATCAQAVRFRICCTTP
jgi:hypothetical protein